MFAMHTYCENILQRHSTIFEVSLFDLVAKRKQKNFSSDTNNDKQVTLEIYNQPYHYIV